MAAAEAPAVVPGATVGLAATASLGRGRGSGTFATVLASGVAVSGAGSALADGAKAIIEGLYTSLAPGIARVMRPGGGLGGGAKAPGGGAVAV